MCLLACRCVSASILRHALPTGRSSTLVNYLSDANSYLVHWLRACTGPHARPIRILTTGTELIRACFASLPGPITCTCVTVSFCAPAHPAHFDYPASRPLRLSSRRIIGGGQPRTWPTGRAARLRHKGRFPPRRRRRRYGRPSSPLRLLVLSGRACHCCSAGRTGRRSLSPFAPCKDGYHRCFGYALRRQRAAASLR